tara:strand:- start:166 stop:345 length:180 start_codon:yes stop_codon:yes gene_type:complete
MPCAACGAGKNFKLSHTRSAKPAPKPVQKTTNANVNFLKKFRAKNYTPQRKAFPLGTLS